MLKSKKHFVLSIFILVFCGFSFCTYYAWRGMKEAAMLECLSSIANEVDRAVRQKQVEINNQPRELTESEVEELLSKINAYSCHNSQLLPKEIHIAVGEVNKISQIRIKVWTTGDDRIVGTSDDLVIPWGEKVY